MAGQVYSQNHVMNGAGVELLWRRCFYFSLLGTSVCCRFLRLKFAVQPLWNSSERDVMQRHVAHHPAARASAVHVGRL